MIINFRCESVGEKLNVRRRNMVWKRRSMVAVSDNVISSYARECVKRSFYPSMSDFV